MGYTQTDCVICYLGGYGNRESPVRRVCCVCIESVYEEEGFGQVQSECMNHFAGDGKCERCHDERIFLYSVGLCDNDVLVDDEDDNLEFEDYDDDDEDDFDGEDYDDYDDYEGDEDEEEKEKEKEKFDDNSQE